MKRSLIVLVLLFFFGLVVRLYQLGQTPPALNWDEASLGYNAYSISQTLRDEHGEFFPIQRFVAFGDYKPPLYIYAAALSVKLFGLTEFSTRVPSAIAGSALVLVTFFLTSELLCWWKKRQDLELPITKSSLLAAFLVCISPWTLQLSRGAFEGNLATLLSGLGAYFLLRTFRQHYYKWSILAAFFLVASMYTFNSHRVFTPLFLLVVTGVNVRNIFRSRKLLLVIMTLFALFTILFSPMVPHLMSPEGRLRFDEVSWVKDTSLVEKANARIQRDTMSGTFAIADNRRVDYVTEFLKHFTDHLKPDYLFFHGDENARLSTQDTGEFYLVELIFLLAGVFLLLKHRQFPSAFLGLWIVIGLIPGSLARETPHALRTLNIVPAPQIIAAFGAMTIFLKYRRSLMILIFVAIYGALFLFHTRYYFSRYNLDFASQWQYGYKEMVRYVSSVRGKYDEIQVTGKYGRPYIYFLFFSQYQPEKYWQTRDAKRDQFGFWSVNRFDKYVFHETPGNSSQRKLVVGDDTVLSKDTKILKTITDPSGRVVFQIYEN